jgi:ABC-type glutathione transport system ATPase component
MVLEKACAGILTCAIGLRVAELLKIEGLTIAIGGKPVVRQASLSLEKGRTLGIVGETGSGKSLTALAVLGLLPKAASITEGSLVFEGRDLRGLSPVEYCSIRGARISMVFQEPFTCLNPVQRVAAQVAEVLSIHKGLGSVEAGAQALEWLERVGIPDAAQRGRQYPHQWSGGMRQRAMIAMALACHPSLLIADEPTTALDVTVQTQILDLLKGMGRELGVTLILISHDLGVIDAMADTVAVMKAGQVLEQGDKDKVFGDPQHAYTRELIASYVNWAGKP